MDEKSTILGLDVSTKTIGIALFQENGNLLELTHITPRPKPKQPTSIGELISKADIFKEYIVKYKELNIDKIIIEEPLLRSNNELMKSRKEGLKPVLFGGYDTKADKKMIVWEKVANLEPQIVWLYTRNQTLKKESFDMTDAYTCVLGHMKETGHWA